MLPGIVPLDFKSRQRRRYGHYLGQDIVSGLIWICLHLIVISWEEAELKHFRRSRNPGKLRKNHFTSISRAKLPCQKWFWNRQPVWCLTLPCPSWVTLDKSLGLFEMLLLCDFWREGIKEMNHLIVSCLYIVQFNLLKFNPNCLTCPEWHQFWWKMRREIPSEWKNDTATQRMEKTKRLLI